MLNLNDIIFNKRLGNLTGRYFETPYFYYCQPLATIIVKTMRILLTIGLFIIATCSQAESFDFQDSVKVDKKKIDDVIKKIKKRKDIDDSKYTIKDFDNCQITVLYPDQFLPGQDFSVDVLYKGEVILIYGIKPDTYEFGEIIDLR